MTLDHGHHEDLVNGTGTGIARGPELLPFPMPGPDETLVREAPIAIYSVDFRGRILSWNPAAEEMFGWKAGEIIGRQVPFLPAEERERAAEALIRLIQGESVPPVEYRPVRKDGTRIDALSSASVLTAHDGTPLAIVAYAIDITAQRRAVETVAQAEHKWRVLLESTNDTVTLVDHTGRVKQTTGEFTDVLGYPAEWWSGRSGFDLIHPDDRTTARELFTWALNHPGEPITDVFRTHHRDGRWELIEYTAVNKLDDPAVDAVVITTHNVTEVRLAEALVSDEAGVLELIARNASLRDILDEVVRMIEFHTGGRAGVFILDRAAPADAQACASSELLHTLEVAAAGGVAGTCGEAIRLRETVIVPDVRTHPLTAADPGPFLVAGIRSAWSRPILDTDDSEVLGTIAVYNPDPREPTPRELDVVGVASHLTAIALERDRVQRRLEHQARHDQLTGLPNRWAIVERVEAALDRADDRGAVAVVLIDLDRFKLINDSLGHEAGDTVLVAFGERLRSLVGGDDLVGHFGGDEFVVVMEGVEDIEVVHRFASRLDLALSEPFTIALRIGDAGELAAVPVATTTSVDVGGPIEHQIFLSTSIGVALGHDRSMSGHQLLQQADTAMFRAKDRGRDRLEVFDDGMRRRAAEHLRMDRELRLAVERAQLRVHYQPKIDLATGRIIGAEALLRWDHPERGLVTPSEFIGLAEETGLIVRIGAWVLDEAVRAASTWRERAGTESFRISVNLSPRQLMAPGLVSMVARTLARHRWPPGQLVLELTESLLIDDADAALGVLQQLEVLGVQLAIDDFGTGYSSLGYLHRFPFDVVKVDREFVGPLDANGEGSAVAAAVMHMARALDLQTVAEGVESDEQLAGLRALGCGAAQGFYFSEPVLASGLTRLLENDPRW
ncbi:sensor domain-containing protein [Rhabdothermincola sediminis]|uniref:sensor domain-containing protein n=1 Tax=Rhabdothermincola sediminis TaxID=2751370 RepID=UPI001AA0A57E|nr:EAL domain-containing protein [Rhabdothermincola sediminis]